MTEHSPRFVRRADAARLLSCSPRTLEAYASRGDGPPFVRLGRRLVVYEVSALLDWVKSRQCRSTAEPIKAA